MKCTLTLFLISISIVSSALHAQTPCIKQPGIALNSCQMFDVWKNAQGQNVLVDSYNKYNIPLGAQIAANRTQLSYLRKQNTPNHPTGQQLFPTEGALSAQLNGFLKSISQDTYFLVYFSRIHLIILHELYQYLMGIYATMNMTRITDPDPKEKVKKYLANEMNQALNKKTMIINHFISIIEAQSNQAILSRFPGLPKHLATRFGTMMMKHDYGADLNLLIEKQEIALFPDDPTTQKAFQKRRELYLEILGNYLRFFKSYCATLEQPDPVRGSAFVKHAQDIQKILAAEAPKITKTTSAKQRAAMLEKIKTINPPLFFYDEEVLRSMKIIPKLAKALPPNSQKVEWPETLVKAAQAGSIQTNLWGVPAQSKQPVAYFVTKDGSGTDKPNQAFKLFANIPTASHMYTQELIKQPEWLNSYEGVLAMLKVCLGDYTALFDTQLKAEKILDPCMTCILMNAAIKGGVLAQSAETKTICDQCQTYLKTVQALIAQQQVDVPTAPPQLPPPSGPPGGPPGAGGGP